MRQSGFTLIEMVVVLAVVAILAAIMTPTIMKNIDDSKMARANNEVQVIAAALASCYKDLGFWPRSSDHANAATRNNLVLLYSAQGDVATSSLGQANPWISTTATAGTLESQLIANPGYTTTGERRWAGPYIAEIKADPWGNRYAVNVGQMATTGAAAQAVWVYCTGPDKIANTDSTQLLTASPALANDDIGVRLR